MDKLHINAKKVRILKDFLVRLSYMSDKTCTFDRIIEEFVDVGMLDAKHNFWPDFYENLKTKRRSITRSEMQIIEKYFSQQLKIMLETGHIPEKVYDALGFPKYRVRGAVYDRNDGIESQCTQRAKLLTHCFQQHLRLARHNKIEDKMEKKERDKKKAIDDVIQLNEEDEIKLLL